uniref:Uncharacterized protein n=1 Tax=Caenorhabditis japonica TaxID=281687 RepID=A0A8R1EFE1_CAEJA
MAHRNPTVDGRTPESNDCERKYEQLVATVPVQGTGPPPKNLTCWSQQRVPVTPHVTSLHFDIAISLCGQFIS